MKTPKLADQVHTFYKQYLRHKAAYYFQYGDSSKDEELAYQHGKYDGLVEAARESGMDLDTDIIERCAKTELIEDLRNDIPTLRQSIINYAGAGPEEDIAPLRNRLYEAEQTLDKLLGEHLRTQDFSVAFLPQTGSLEHFGHFYTKEVAQHRFTDVESGADEVTLYIDKSTLKSGSLMLLVP